jgi:hypothetical protein
MENMHMQRVKKARGKEKTQGGKEKERERREWEG